MERRIVLFLILSLAIILGYDYVLRQLGFSPQTPVEQPGSSESAPAESLPEPTPAVTDTEKARPTPPTKRSKGGLATTPPEERLEEVHTDVFRAVFSNKGAEVRSWELKRYTIGPHDERRPVELAYKGTFKGPLSLQGNDVEQNKQATEGLYYVERDFTTLDAAHPVGHLTFTIGSREKGTWIQKHLTFHHDSYLVDVAIKTSGFIGPLQVNLGSDFGIVEWGEGFIGLIGPALMVNGAIEKDMPKDTELERQGAVRWVALQDKYFISVLIPQDLAAPSAAVIRKEGDKLVSGAIRFPSAADVALQLYAGPKEYDTLKSLSLGLEDTIDFGWFIYGSWGIVKAVAKPLFSVLRFLYEYTHNYGVAIILLTLAIKLLFVPLQYKSYKSMKDMQLIQPKVVAVQAKYKDDRERLNRELIKLYRDHKVNPVGGCLPMLLQMPVFVALFNILYMTIDLRQAPFVLWINDLSVQDPYYVLPILMGVSMVIQQKIMPSTMDPTQAKIMLLLPAFLTVLFVTFPAGLVLYWLTNNVLTITQQFVTDRYIFKRSAPGAPPSALSEGGEDGQKGSGKKKKDRLVEAGQRHEQRDATIDTGAER
jgi:YidC/Oxa1 family membrane protein insertase